MKNLEPSEHEIFLLKQISEIDQQIADLTSEKYALQNVLSKVRKQDNTNKDVTRKNSFERIITENKIIEVLKRDQKSVDSKTLYLECLNVNFQLKQNTFRSHLHRMKNKGIIDTVEGRRGWWKLIE